MGVLLTGNTVFAEPVPDLAKYPKAPRIWLGIEEALVRPKAYSQGRTMAAGNVRLMATDGQALKKGELWAVLDPQGLELERRSLEVEEYKFTQKIREDKRNQRDKTVKIQLDVNDIQEKKSKLQLALESEETPVEIKRRIREGVKKADEEIAALQEFLSADQQAKELQMEEEEARVALEKKKKDFEASKKRSELIALSDGVLKLSSQAKDALTEKPDGLIWLDGNIHIGSISEENAVEIVVSAKSPLVNQINKDDLLVLMEEGRSGRLISAEFEKVDELDTGSDVQQNYVFKVASDSMEGARNVSGQRNLVHVYRKLPQPCHIVLKKDIAFIDPAALERAGWEGLAIKLWPGCKVVQVASQTLAIQAPNGN